MARLKKKIASALKEHLFDDPRDIVDVSDGEDSEDLHLVVISNKLKGRGLRERTHFIWDELTRRLDPEEWGRISLTISLTPKQVNGATIKELKMR
jgi:hypothetical protein